MSTAYPADAARDAAFAATSHGDADGAYRAARRHSRYVRALRVIVLTGIAVVLLGVMAANYMPAVGPIRLPGELGKLVIKGTKITMQAPKLTGYTSDFRPYEFTADTAAQDINKPDLVEVLRHYRGGIDRGRLIRTDARHRRMPVDQRPARRGPRGPRHPARRYARARRRRSAPRRAGTCSPPISRMSSDS